MTTETKIPTGRHGIVYVIDDDAGFRTSLGNLLQSTGHNVDLFPSPTGFIEDFVPDMRGCILLDIRFPDASGLDSLAEFKAASITLPVILMTGHGDVPSSVRGLKGGAIDYLVKPFGEDELLPAVRAALDHDELRVAQRAEAALLAERYASLTSREREVLALVCEGLMNKQIAGRLDLSEITAKVHRGTMMRKMCLRNVPDLVRAHNLLNGRQT